MCIPKKNKNYIRILYRERTVFPHSQRDLSGRNCCAGEEKEPERWREKVVVALFFLSFSYMNALF